MPETLLDLACKQITDLFSSASPEERFRASATDIAKYADLLNSYTFGEIFWKKALGRPASASLWEAFKIDAWSYVEMQLPGPTPNSIRFETIRWPLGPDSNGTYEYLLSDGQSDDEHWRVNFSIPNMKTGKRANTYFAARDLPTYVIPRLKHHVAWDTPALRLFHRREVEFVKMDAPAFVSFELSHGIRWRWTMDKDGVVVKN